MTITISAADCVRCSILNDLGPEAVRLTLLFYRKVLSSLRFVQQTIDLTLIAVFVVCESAPFSGLRFSELFDLCSIIFENGFWIQTCRSIVYASLET